MHISLSGIDVDCAEKTLVRIVKHVIEAVCLDYENHRRGINKMMAPSSLPCQLTAQPQQLPRPRS